MGHLTGLPELSNLTLQGLLWFSRKMSLTIKMYQNKTIQTLNTGIWSWGNGSVLLTDLEIVQERFHCSLIGMSHLQKEELKCQKN